MESQKKLMRDKEYFFITQYSVNKIVSILEHTTVSLSIFKSLKVPKIGSLSGGQRGIRTPGELPHGRVPGDWIKPLSHLPIFTGEEV